MVIKARAERRGGLTWCSRRSHTDPHSLDREFNRQSTAGLEEGETIHNSTHDQLVDEVCRVWESVQGLSIRHS